MQLELIFSRSDLDVTDEAVSVHPAKSLVRSHIDEDSFVYQEFSFADRAGRNLPFVRIALGTKDAIDIIETLAERGDPEAERIRDGYTLAISIAAFAKNSH
jgi:alkylation response protein AidB-like acyl-CoA dehydrogenase